MFNATLCLCAFASTSICYEHLLEYLWRLFIWTSKYLRTKFYLFTGPSPLIVLSSELMPRTRSPKQFPMVRNISLQFTIAYILFSLPSNLANCPFTVSASPFERNPNLNWFVYVCMACITFNRQRFFCCCVESQRFVSRNKHNGSYL